MEEKVKVMSNIDKCLSILDNEYFFSRIFLSLQKYSVCNVTANKNQINLSSKADSDIINCFSYWHFIE